MNIEVANKFADYFEKWWKPKYEMWMVCARGPARNIMDTNNLIEAFHRKLKYTYMRGRPGRRIDGEVYLLIEIVLRDMNFSCFLNELQIGRMNPQQRQQRIREIIGTHINKKDIFNIQQDTWIVHSMTNDDVEYSVRRRSANNEDKLDISSYICTCRDFRIRQLPCKHIFAVFSQSNNKIEENNEKLSLNSIVKKSVSIDQEVKIKNTEVEKLQDDLSAIAAEWKNKSENDVRSLRTALLQTVQMERTRIARTEIVPEQIVNNEGLNVPSQIASNIKFKKQNKF